MSDAKFNYSIVRIVSTFYTHTYPALFMSLRYIHLHHFDMYTACEVLIMPLTLNWTVLIEGQCVQHAGLPYIALQTIYLYIVVLY